MFGAEKAQCPVATDEFKLWRCNNRKSQYAVFYDVLRTAEFLTQRGSTVRYVSDAWFAPFSDRRIHCYLCDCCHVLTLPMMLVRAARFIGVDAEYSDNGSLRICCRNVLAHCRVNKGEVSRSALTSSDNWAVVGGWLSIAERNQLSIAAVVVWSAF